MLISFVQPQGFPWPEGASGNLELNVPWKGVLGSQTLCTYDFERCGLGPKWRQHNCPQQHWKLVSVLDLVLFTKVILNGFSHPCTQSQAQEAAAQYKRDIKASK